MKNYIYIVVINVILSVITHGKNVNFSIDNFAEFISPSSPKSFPHNKFINMQDFNLIVYSLHGETLQIASYCSDSNTMAILEKTKVEKMIGEFKKNDINTIVWDRQYLYRPDGVFEWNPHGAEFSRVFSKNAKYPDIFELYIKTPPEAYNTIIKLLKSYEIQFEKKKDYIEAAYIKDIINIMEVKFKLLQNDGKVSFSNENVTVKGSLSPFRMINELEISIHKPLIYFFISTNGKEKCSLENVAIYDIIYHPVDFKTNPGEYGFDIKDRKLYLDKNWSKYLYGSTIFQDFFSTEIKEINGKDVTLHTKDSINKLMKENVSIVVKLTNGMEHNFIKFNVLQIDVIETAQRMNFPSEKFFH